MIEGEIFFDPFVRKLQREEVHRHPVRVEAFLELGGLLGFLKFGFEKSFIKTRNLVNQSQKLKVKN